MVAKTTEKKEYAASVFLKWITAPEQNMRFISKTGYLPVTKKAFETDMQQHLSSVEDIRIKRMLTEVLSMYDSYRFFTAPTFRDFDSIGKGYEKRFKALLTDERQAYLLGMPISENEALTKISTP